MSPKTEFSNRLRQAMKDAGSEWLGCCKPEVLRFGEAVRQAVRAQRAGGTRT